MIKQSPNCTIYQQKIKAKFANNSWSFHTIHLNNVVYGQGGKHNTDVTVETIIDRCIPSQIRWERLLMIQNQYKKLRNIEKQVWSIRKIPNGSVQMAFSLRKNTKPPSSVSLSLQKQIKPLKFHQNKLINQREIWSHHLRTLAWCDASACALRCTWNTFDNTVISD